MSERHGSVDPYLICRIGNRHGALALHQVAETLRPLATQPLASLPEFVLGVCVIRGEAVPMVDARRLLGVTADSAPGRYVTLKVDGRRVGLAVDDVLGIRNLPSTSFKDAPPLLAEAAHHTIAAIATLDAQLLVVLRGTQLLPEQAWQALDRETTPS